jgi:predicted transcriptional regulator
MKFIDRLLVAALVRRNAVLADGDMDLPQALAATRTEVGVTRADVARRVGISVAEVLAFDLGLVDPPLSAVRRYAHASGLLVEHHVESDSEADR